MPPWVFDVVVITVIILSAVMSVGRGLIREAFSVIAFIIGGLSAWVCIKLFQEPLQQAIAPNDPQSMLPGLILFMVGFLAAYGLAAFLGQRLSKLIHAAPEIGALDRIAGAGFGLLRGALASVLFVLLMHQVVRDGEEPPEIAKSNAYPLLNGAAEWVGDGLTTVIDFFTGPAKAAPVTQAGQ
ncbi:MAG: CvpA family protein [Hyphomonadaceae bacterium]